MTDEIPWPPLSDEEIDHIRRTDWTPFHDPLCEVHKEESIGRKTCTCVVSTLFRALSTVEYLKAKLAQERATKECPWCRGPLTVYHSGVMCAACIRYFERGSWWSVSCDENHAHHRACLVEVELPSTEEA